jgi:hypothetical protein
VIEPKKVRKTAAKPRVRKSYGARVHQGDEESHPSKFFKDYEKMATSWSNKAKIDNLGQYLEGAISDWLKILENELKEEVTMNEQGVQ